MYQPHRRTLRIRPETEEDAFVKKLAAAIVLRAIQDPLSSNDRQADGAGMSDRLCSAEWIFGPDMFASFETWCTLANLNPGAVRKRAKELMAADHVNGRTARIEVEGCPGWWSLTNIVQNGGLSSRTEHSILSAWVRLNCVP